MCARLCVRAIYLTRMRHRNDSLPIRCNQISALHTASLDISLQREWCEKQHIHREPCAQVRVSCIRTSRIYRDDTEQERDVERKKVGKHTSPLSLYGVVENITQCVLKTRSYIYKLDIGFWRVGFFVR